MCEYVRLCVLLLAVVVNVSKFGVSETGMF